jgi:hypothetical protein
LEVKRTKAVAWCRRPTQQLAEGLVEDSGAPIVIEVATAGQHDSIGASVDGAL